MNSHSSYPIPESVYAIHKHLLDLRPDAEVDHDILNPKPITDEKNIWFFWHSGYATMHSYAKRNVRTWHRRFSKAGWSIRVLDLEPNSPLNVANFLDVRDINEFPRAFIDGEMSGRYALQHTSDLVRFPLLLKYGGVYTDVGMIPIGDLDRLWNDTIANSTSPFEVISYNMGGVEIRHLTNHFLVSGRNNPFFARCHRLLLALWSDNGGKTSTEGMHASSLLRGIPMLGEGSTFTIEEDGKSLGPDEVSRLLADYIIQGQVITMVMGLADEEDNWDGPKYCAEHVFAIEYMVGSQLINEYTAWNGVKAFHLMSLSLPKEGEAESEEQKQAREIIEACLQKSFGFKLAHGLIVRVLGETLGTLWRKHDGSDVVPGTYADWLRYGTVHWCPKELPSRLDFEETKPYKIGPLIRD